MRIKGYRIVYQRFESYDQKLHAHPPRHTPTFFTSPLPASKGTQITNSTDFTPFTGHEVPLRKRIKRSLMHRPTSKTSPFPFINHPLPIPPPLIAQLYFSLALELIFMEHHTFSRYDRFSTLPYYLAYVGVRTLRHLLFEISLLSHTPSQSLIMQRRRTVLGSLIPSHHPLPPLPPNPPKSQIPSPLPKPILPSIL